MLPTRLQQIKDMLYKKNQSSELSKEESDLLGEIIYIEDTIQSQFSLGKKEKRRIEPPPDKCPCCGRNFF